MKKKCNNVPSPFNKWLTYKEWKGISKVDRKVLTDLTKLQNILAKHFKNSKSEDEEYHNMNAEIEYLKSIGEH